MDNTDNDEGRADVRPALNPQPKRAYTLTLDLENPPGPFASVEATAQYDVANAAECGNKVPVAGAFPRITRNETFQLRRESDTRYTGTVYADLMLDDDYFGRGVCRWEFVEARIRLRASPDEKDTRFVAAITARDIASEASARTYFWKERYPRVPGIDDYADIGSPTLDPVPEADRHAFFAATLASRETQP